MVNNNIKINILDKKLNENQKIFPNLYIVKIQIILLFLPYEPDRYLQVI